MNPSRENIQNHQNFSTTTTKSKNQSQRQRTEDKQSPASPEAKPESELTERLIKLYNDEMMNGVIAFFFRTDAGEYFLSKIHTELPNKIRSGDQNFQGWKQFGYIFF